MYLKRSEARLLIDALKWAYADISSKGKSSPQLVSVLVECLAMVDRMLAIDTEARKKVSSD